MLSRRKKPGRIGRGTLALTVLLSLAPGAFAGVNWSISVTATYNAQIYGLVNGKYYDDSGYGISPAQCSPPVCVPGTLSATVTVTGTTTAVVAPGTGGGAPVLLITDNYTVGTPFGTASVSNHQYTITNLNYIPSPGDFNMSFPSPGGSSSGGVFGSAGANSSDPFFTPPLPPPNSSGSISFVAGSIGLQQNPAANWPTQLNFVQPPYPYTNLVGSLVSGTVTYSVSLPCTDATISNPGTQSFAVNGWAGTFTVTPQDGLELDDVSLSSPAGGLRYLASKMNLPYFNLQTSDFSSSSGGHCELRPDGTFAPCGARSRLVAFNNSGGAIQAKYQVDQIPGNSGSCLEVTQTYTFGPITVGCEPTNQACAKLTPVVSYTYQPGASETFSSMEAAQRFTFKVDGNTAGASQNTSAFGVDNDSISLATPSATQLAVINGNLLATWKPDDPMSHEGDWLAVVHGAPGLVDNYHQTWNPNGPSLPGLDWEFGRWNWFGGCSECVHIHWRWPAWFPGFGGGVPLVPSPQTVEVAVVSSQKDAHPSADFSSLDTGAALGATTGQAFWHGASSDLPSDTFFPYGLFFLPGGNSSGAGLFRINPLGFLYNSTSKMFSQTVNIVNSSAQPVTGPVSMALDSLSGNATLLNSDGSTQMTLPSGSPYVQLDLGPSNQLAPGATTTAILWFSNPSMKGILYTPRIVTGGIP